MIDDMPERTAEDERLERLIAELKLSVEELTKKAGEADARRHEYQGRIADLENKIGRLMPLEKLAEFADDVHHLLGEVKQ